MTDLKDNGKGIGKDADPRVDPQAELRGFLEDPESYPHGPNSVELIQTHASYVAIAHPFVYKVKKPVDLGFLDFSTLEKRKFYCDEEVRLNARLCDSTYLGVVPIFRAPERAPSGVSIPGSKSTETSLTFVGNQDASPVEYAVKMKAMVKDGFLDHKLDTGGEAAVGPHTIRRIADKLEKFYADCESTPEISEWGSVEKLRISTDENFGQTRKYRGGLIPSATFDTIQAFTNKFYDTHATLFEQRRLEGWILDCHGDLHCEHIHLSEEGVCIYDCIEFNKRFRSIDVASDIAFLSMDLRRHGRAGLGRLLAEQVASALDDNELLTLLPFYACYRAYVRGKVQLMRSDAAEVPEDEREQSRAEARQYFRLALDYAVSGGEPIVVVCMGRVGTGKSTIAENLVELTGWNWSSSDKIRKEQHGLPLYTRTRGRASEVYSKEATERVYNELAQRAVQNAASELSTVVDATYSSRRFREELRETLRIAGIKFQFIEMRARRGAVEERLKLRETQDNVVSDARLEDLDALEERFEVFDGNEEPPLSVGTGGSLDDSLTELLVNLSERFSTD